MAISTDTNGRKDASGLTLQQALEEAGRCMLCHDAPCSSGCPGSTDPGRFIRQIRFLNLKGAARTVLRNNPLGGVCAHICPTEETCKAGCIRAGLDRPIDIDGLQRFAVEYGRANGVRGLEAGLSRSERVAVVGAGPAGLTAAARLAGYGYQVTVFEARAAAGGMLRYGVPASRLSDADLDADIDEVLALGAELRTNCALADDNGATALLDQGYAAVFIATGLWKPYRLSLDGSDLAGVTTAIEFLAQTRTAPDEIADLVDRVRGASVAIIGGGSVAMDVARCAREHGAERIYAIALEGMTELPANEAELHHARQDGIIIKPQCQVTRILGADGAVCGVEGHETEWIEAGRLDPGNARPIEGTSFRLKVGAVVQAIGQGPTDEVGRIVTGLTGGRDLIEAEPGTQATKVQSIYAGGDIVRGAGTVVAAVGDGKRAADAIHYRLSGDEEGIR